MKYTIPNNSQGRGHLLHRSKGMSRLGLKSKTVLSTITWVTGLRTCERLLAVALLCAAVALLPACDGDSGQQDLPSQNYVDALTALAQPTGDLEGQILFPSEYSQHSIRFTLDALTFVTHPDGRFRIKRVPAGSRRISIRIKGYEPVESTFELKSGGQLALDAMRLVQARGRVLGRLVTNNGRSAEGVRVRMEPDQGAVVSDMDGIFQFHGVGSGKHMLVFRDQVYFAGNVHIELIPNETRNLGNIRVYRQTRGDARSLTQVPLTAQP